VIAIGAASHASVLARTSRMAKVGSYLNRRDLAALSATFFGAINGAHCEPAAKMGGSSWSGHVFWACITGAVDQELLFLTAEENRSWGYDRIAGDAGQSGI
jgi:hypothetical protein